MTAEPEGIERPPEDLPVGQRPADRRGLAGDDGSVPGARAGDAGGPPLGVLAPVARHRPPWIGRARYVSRHEPNQQGCGRHRHPANRRLLAADLPALRGRRLRGAPAHVRDSRARGSRLLRAHPPGAWLRLPGRTRHRTARTSRPSWTSPRTPTGRHLARTGPEAVRPRDGAPAAWRLATEFTRHESCRPRDGGNSGAAMTMRCPCSPARGS